MNPSRPLMPGRLVALILASLLVVALASGCTRDPLPPLDPACFPFREGQVVRAKGGTLEGVLRLLYPHSGGAYVVFQGLPYGVTVRCKAIVPVDQEQPE